MSTICFLCLGLLLSLLENDHLVGQTLAIIDSQSDRVTNLAQWHFSQTILAAYPDLMRPSLLTPPVTKQSFPFFQQRWVLSGPLKGFLTVELYIWFFREDTFLLPIHLSELWR